MKTKIIKTVLIAGLFVISAFASANVIKSYYKTMRADFLIHGKGKAQQFIISSIN
jgi:hypothetical protein